MLTADEIAARREAVAQFPDLAALLETVERRAEAVLERPPLIPAVKALLSTDGGICPVDGAPLLFDPWNGEEHRCSRCGGVARGERHHRHWARFQHLWLGERIADLGAVAALTGRDDAADCAAELLRQYGEHYFEYPNRDNVLGPSRLFFSTYLESVWLCSVLAGAYLLREAGLLDQETESAVNQLADEAANLIGEFDEGASNRQTWHNAALLAVAVWFEDEELATRAIEGGTGLLAHLMEGFGPDGLWYEGENYHLFALRGLLIGFGWAGVAGVDLLEDAAIASRLDAVLRAPALTALPDGSFPARKDARYGISLAQPMYLELWEIGLGSLREHGAEDQDLEDWLAALYRLPAPPAEPFESYLHEQALPAASARNRTHLSWWALLRMPPEATGDPAGWTPPSTLLEGQGLAVLRAPGRYASLECGRSGGGHGHPDRLNLILHAGGIYWLPDFGTGSYVSRDLFWYRSTLAHNAPLLDGRSQPLDEAGCLAFDVSDGWAWARGSFGPLVRTLVAGPDYLLDRVELNGTDRRRLELPWHLAGEILVEGEGRWVPEAVEGEFLSDAARWEPAGDGPLVLSAEQGSARVKLHLSGPTELVRCSAPGAPTEPQRRAFVVAGATGQNLRIVTVIDLAGGVAAVHSEGDQVVVTTEGGDQVHRLTNDGWDIEAAGSTVQLRGGRAGRSEFQPLVTGVKPLETVGRAHWVSAPPALDGSLDGMDLSDPLRLDHEDQYRRSEEPYPGPDELSATAWLNWHDDRLYLAVDVSKPELCFRAADAPPLRLDNETDDIHSDGLQVYLAAETGERVAVLIVPEPGGGIRIRPVSGADSAAGPVEGGWVTIDGGYRVTLSLPLGEPPAGHGPRSIGFDLIVNEMLPGRERRAGQLVWSGGGGWVWLRGDRQAADRFGRLELV